MPVSTREEFRAHVASVLESSETLCCTVFSTANQKAQSDIFYHPLTNTLVIVPANPAHEPTAYRPDDGFGLFYIKVEQSMQMEERVLQVVNSIYELRPELAAAREVQRIKAEDEKLRDAVEQRFQKEKKDMLDRHERELKHSSDPKADMARHAQELRVLEEQKEKDFERHRREREDVRKLIAQQKEREKTFQKDGPELGRGRTR